MSTQGKRLAAKLAKVTGRSFQESAQMISQAFANFEISAKNWGKVEPKSPLKTSVEKALEEIQDCF